MRTRTDVSAAVIFGAVERVRPTLMTVLAIMAGLVPIRWSQNTGTDVVKRIAATTCIDHANAARSIRCHCD